MGVLEILCGELPCVAGSCRLTVLTLSTQLPVGSVGSAARSPSVFPTPRRLEIFRIHKKTTKFANDADLEQVSPEHVFSVFI